MLRGNDRAVLCGTPAGRPEKSHTGRDGDYYRFMLAVDRLSGASDTLPILVRERDLAALELEEKPRLRVEGELRSFHDPSGRGPRLVLSVLAHRLVFTEDPCENDILLAGTVCRQPIYRRTPLGREIADVMLAVSRRYGRSDRLPVIFWGANARRAALWAPGTAIQLTGRLQSRLYRKETEAGTVERTAYEVSAAQVSEQEPYTGRLPPLTDRFL